MVASEVIKKCSFGPTTLKGLKMATLYMSKQDGVIGIMAEAQHEQFRQLDESLVAAEEQDWPTPIFTFANEGHPEFDNMTGSLERMEALLRGHEVIETMFAVPFANAGTQSGSRYRTSREQIDDVFGVAV